MNEKPVAVSLPAFLLRIVFRNPVPTLNDHAIYAPSVGRAAALVICRKAAGEESPGSMEIRCRVTPGGVTPGIVPQKADRPSSVPLSRSGRDDGVRVKGWGKSPPRRWQHRRHGKPHWEQNRIGTAHQPERADNQFPDQPSGWVARGGWRHPSQMNGCHVGRKSGHTEPGLQTD